MAGDAGRSASRPCAFNVLCPPLPVHSAGSCSLGNGGLIWFGPILQSSYRHESPMHLPEQKITFRSTPDDVIQSYRFFLGRDPEASRAIQGRLDLGVEDFFQIFITAQEFLLKTLKPLAEAVPLPHAIQSARPDVSLKRWAAERMPLTETGAGKALNATTWSDLLLAVLTDADFLGVVPAEYATVISRATVQAAARKPHVPTLGTFKDLIGAVEYHGGNEVTGWAANARDLAERVFLEFHVDNLYIGAAQCSLYRRELAERLGGDGYHGFAFTVPTSCLPLLKKGARITIKEVISKQRIARDLHLQYDDFDFSDFVDQVTAEIHDLKAALGRLEASLPVVGKLSSLPLDRYDAYHRAYYEPTMRQERLMERLHAALPRRPDIVVGLHAAALTMGQIVDVLDDLVGQTYGDWSAVVVFDIDAPADQIAILRDRYAGEPRVAVLAGPATRLGQTAALVAAGVAARATTDGGGAWIGLVAQPIRLAWDALSHIVRASLQDGVRLIYGDHDECHVDAGGSMTFHSPSFKTALDYQLLLCRNVIGSLFFMEAECFASLATSLQGPDAPPDGDFTYDLLLLFTEQHRRSSALHLPRILHHLCRPTAETGSEQSRPAANRASVERHLVRRGIQATVEDVQVPNGSHPLLPVTWVTWPLPDQAPTLSVIVPTKDKFLLIGPCFESLLASRRFYPGKIQIIIVDHESTCNDTVDFLNRARAVEDVMVLGYAGAFNWSAINNFAARHATGDVLLFLNNDMTVISETWCREMVACALLPEVGAVGAKLLYEDGTLQHAGVVLGVDGGAMHEYAGESPRDGGYLGRTALRHSAAAVTGACLATRRTVFQSVGGFDAVDFRVTFNDVDYCLKLRERGLDVVYTPAAMLYHFESKSRGFDMTFEKQDRARAELEALRRRWPDMIRSDPFFNPHFSRHAKPFMRLGPPPSLG
ncbi:glycosyltransferase (plasmid) [Azospirillum sp. 412522]|nr:glycosyltransferase [Azospirillum sp. 412522]MBY6266517.1 glycosyltransferase [Azospirillum sp. 412522]